MKNNKTIVSTLLNKHTVKNLNKNVYGGIECNALSSSWDCYTRMTDTVVYLSK